MLPPLGARWQGAARADATSFSSRRREEDESKESMNLIKETIQEFHSADSLQCLRILFLLYHISSVSSAALLHTQHWFLASCSSFLSLVQQPSSSSISHMFCHRHFLTFLTRQQHILCSSDVAGCSNNYSHPNLKIQSLIRSGCSLARCILYPVALLFSVYQYRPPYAQYICCAYSYYENAFIQLRLHSMIVAPGTGTLDVDL